LPEKQGAESLPGILASIVRTKLDDLGRLEARAAQLEAAALDAPPARDFRGALAGSSSVSLVAECKRRSPGAGAIRPELNPADLTVGYEGAGAAALSVLTDEQYFGGSVDDLEAVRAAVHIPVLRKDFTLHPLHVLEARASGADAVLLIVRILSDAELGDLHALARDLGMSVLVEVHDEAELARAGELGADLIGINNRDLSTFTTDLATTIRLIDRAPADAVLVSESGIRTREDVQLLGDAGVDAILVGESLLRAEDPYRAAEALTRVPRREGARV
jgi:indole-3-glycerol phosphate synthase